MLQLKITFLAVDAGHGLFKERNLVEGGGYDGDPDHA
jgi:hypothetical protein